MFRREVVREHEERHVTHNLRRGGDLHDIAEQLVHRGVGAADLVPPVTDAERVRLLVKVRILPTGHLVEIHFGRTCELARFERGIVLPDIFPVVRGFLERFKFDIGVAIGVT